MGNAKSYYVPKKHKFDKFGNEVKPEQEKNDSRYPAFLQRLAEVLLDKSEKEDGSNNISCNVFKKYLCNAYEPLGEKLYYYFLRSEPSDSKELTVECFLSQASALIECHTNYQQLQFYIKAFAQDPTDITGEEFTEFVRCSYAIGTFSRNTDSAEDLLQALTKGVMHGKTKVTITYALHWLCQHCSGLVSWIHKYLCHILTVGYGTIPNNEETTQHNQDTPILDSASELSCISKHPALIWILSCTLPINFLKSANVDKSQSIPEKIHDPHSFITNAMLGDTPTHWVALYNSSNDGLSLNRFTHHVFDYPSPSLLFITTEDYMFCVAVDEQWRNSKHFFGGPACMCIQLLPKYQIVEKGSKLIYFNTTSKGFPEGFQIGIDATSRALSIDHNLKLVHYKQVPSKLEALEVWGCGTEVARQRQQEYKRLTNKDVEARRVVKVNVNDWVDHPDRCLLEMAGARPTYAMYEKDTQSSFSKT